MAEGAAYDDDLPDIALRLGDGRTLQLIGMMREVFCGEKPL